jgi:uncharacterized protein (TIGR02647 family)
VILFCGYACHTINTGNAVMTLSDDLIHEINLLLKFDLSNAQSGLKIHSNAVPEVIAAAQRLFDKKLVDHQDGGYLTALGYEAAEQLQAAHRILAV